MLNKTPLVIALLSSLALAACAGGHQTAPPVNTAVTPPQAYIQGPPSPATLDALEAAYKRDPNDAENAVRYSAGLENAGRTRRALMVLTPFVDNGQADSNAALLTRYAAAQEAMGDNDTAATEARKAVALQPDNGEASYLLGRALENGGDHLNAEIAFRQALAHWSGNPGPVLNDLGLNLAAQGLYDDAVDTLKKAIAEQPNQPEYERNLRIVQALQSQPGTHGTKLVPPPPPKPEAH